MFAFCDECGERNWVEPDTISQENPGFKCSKCGFFCLVIWGEKDKPHVDEKALGSDGSTDDVDDLASDIEQEIDE
ncbi:MAG: hypothetical protein ACLFOY_12020 [Desulfatibacillaceae bacterium]